MTEVQNQVKVAVSDVSSPLVVQLSQKTCEPVAVCFL